MPRRWPASTVVARQRRPWPAANGGTLVAFRTLGDDVLVTVVVDGVQATARASRAP